MPKARNARAGARWTLLVACLGALAACQLAAPPVSAPPEPVPAAWRVDEQIGQVLVRHPAAPAWSPLTQTAELHEGDQVQTGSGAALILTRPGHQIVSGANSHLALPGAGAVVHQQGVVRYRAGQGILVEVGRHLIQADEGVFVVGTHADEAVLEVEQGEVRLQGPGEPARRLAAGRRFSFETKTAIAAVGPPIRALPVAPVDLARAMPAVALAAMRPPRRERPSPALEEAAPKPETAVVASASPTASAARPQATPFRALVAGLLDGVAEAGARRPPPVPSPEPR